MTVRVGLVGCGFIGLVHTAAINAVVGGGLVDAAIVSVCDSDRERAELMAAGVDGARASDDPTTAFAGVDAAYVCTPTAQHAEVVDAALATGVALYLEKPLAPDLAGAAAITERVLAAGVINQVGLVLRASPAVGLAADLCAGAVDRLPPELAAGGLGRPMAAVLRDDQCFPIGGMYGSQWRADVAVAGGGTLIEHSIHDLDLLAWLLGPIETVSARTANFAGHPGVEDVAVATLAHASGATSSLVSVWHGVTTRPSTRRLEVFCDSAFMSLEDEQIGPVRVERSAGVAELGLPPDVAAVMDALAVPEEIRPALLTYALADLGFLRAVAGGTPAGPDVAVALDAHRVADAAYRSAAAGGAPTTTAAQGAGGR